MSMKKTTTVTRLNNPLFRNNNKYENLRKADHFRFQYSIFASINLLKFLTLIFVVFTNLPFATIQIMALMEFCMWGFYLILVLAQYQFEDAQGAESVPGLGINWGALASHPLNPNIVVNMLKDNGIKKVKLFDADPWTVGALAGTDIEVMVGIPNDQLSKFAASSHTADDWVKANITKHLHGRHGVVNIRYNIKFHVPSHHGKPNYVLLPI